MKMTTRQIPRLQKSTYMYEWMNFWIIYWGGSHGRVRSRGSLAIARGARTIASRIILIGTRSPRNDIAARIIDFIGYVQPHEIISEMTIGQKITTCRKIKGISQEELARQLGFDPGTIAQ